MTGGGGGDDASFISIFFGQLYCQAPFDCDRKFDQYGGILLWLALMLYMFKALGTICDEYFVPALEVIVEKLDISSDVAGATFMAAGSSAPELFTSLVATFLIVNEGGVGTIVGSAIFNILVIIGITSIVACQERALPIWWYPLARDCFFYVLSIIELVVFLSDEKVLIHEGLIMIATYVLYCFYMKLNPRIVRYFGLVAPPKGTLSDSQAPECSEQPGSSDTWEDPVQKVKIRPVDEPGGTCADSGAIGASSSTAWSVVASSKSVSSNQSASSAMSAALSMPGAVGTGDKAQAPVKWSMKRQKSVEHFNAASAQSVVPGDSKIVEPHRTSSKSSRTSKNPKEAPDEIRPPSKEHAMTLCSVTPTAEGGVPATTLPLGKATADGDQAGPDEDGAEDSELKVGSTGETPEANEDDDCDDIEEIVDEEEDEEPRKGWCQDPLTLLMELIMPDASRHCALLFTLSVAFIGLATYLMVDSTHRIGIILKAPPLFMGLIFLAAGTSIPDAMGSVAVAKQGEGDMAVANSLGSNVFDILIGLGVPWTLRCLMGKKVEFPGKFDMLAVDIGILAAVLVLLVLAMVLNKWRLTMKLGYVLLGFYGVYIIYNIAAVWIFGFKEVEDD